MENNKIKSSQSFKEINLNYISTKCIETNSKLSIVSGVFFIEQSNKITKRASKATDSLISPATEIILLKKNGGRAKKILTNKNLTPNFPKINTSSTYLVSTPGTIKKLKITRHVQNIK